MGKEKWGIPPFLPQCKSALIKQQLFNSFKSHLWVAFNFLEIKI